LALCGQGGGDGAIWASMGPQIEKSQGVTMPKFGGALYICLHFYGHVGAPGDIMAGGPAELTGPPGDIRSFPSYYIHSRHCIQYCLAPLLASLLILFASDYTILCTCADYFTPGLSYCASWRWVWVGLITCSTPVRLRGNSTGCTGVGWSIPPPVRAILSLCVWPAGPRSSLPACGGRPYWAWAGIGSCPPDLSKCCPGCGRYSGARLMEAPPFGWEYRCSAMWPCRALVWFAYVHVICLQGSG
jgi:hypothetical protein